MEGPILHYRILRRLGAGGMGEVYLAEDERLGRRVALKFLPRTEADHPERRARLRQEARSLASLAHPGIAAIHALEEHEDRLFLVMELIEGETLADRIARRPLPIAEVIERGRVLAEALAHAHARGVVHRDVKPANILITPDGATKLADFGLALAEGATRLTVEGGTSGTAGYMSPEQTRGPEVDARTDLFSLGVVLYECLTGARPFARPSMDATVHAVRSDEPEPPTALRSGIPLELERIVLKCLRKNPKERYQHAADLAADLSALGTVVASGPASSAGTVTATAIPAATRASATATRARARGRALALVTAGLIVAAAAAYLLGGLRPRSDVHPAAAAERSIAVLSFQHIADPSDTRREAKMATSLLTVALGQSQVIPILGVQRIQDVLRQMGKENTGLSGADALEVGRRAGATYVVTGFIYQTAPEVVLAAEVASTADGAVLTSSRVKAPGGEQGIFAAIDSLATGLRQGLAGAGFSVRGSAIDVAELTTRNPAAYRSYVRGIDLLYRADIDGAVRALDEAVRADSSFALAWYYLTVATWWSADIHAAERDVVTATRLGDRMVGREREGLHALHTLVRSEYKDAAMEYRALLKRYPDDKEFLYGLGEALYHQGGQDEAAKAAFERTVELDPTFAVAYTHIIDIDVAREDFAAAVASADRFHRINPTNSVPLVLKTNALGYAANPEGSLAAAREALAVDPRTIEALDQVATYHRMTGHFDSAAVYNQRVREVAAQSQEAISSGPLMLVAQGRFREAERVTSDILRRSGADPPRFANVLVAHARVRALLGLQRNDEALAQSRRNAEMFRALGRRELGPVAAVGDIALRVGRVDVAEQVLRDCDRILRTRANRYDSGNRGYLAGLVALSKGRPKEAVALLERTKPPGPPHMAHQMRDWAMARALLAAGERDRGLAALERTVARGTFSGEPTITFAAAILLAEQYEARGRRDDALALYRRVAHQFRQADPGVRENDKAREGIARLLRAKAQAAAD